MATISMAKNRKLKQRSWDVKPEMPALVTASTEKRSS
jgi:hypothetical protein